MKTNTFQMYIKNLTIMRGQNFDNLMLNKQYIDKNQFLCKTYKSFKTTKNKRLLKMSRLLFVPSGFHKLHEPINIRFY